MNVNLDAQLLPVEKYILEHYDAELVRLLLSSSNSDGGFIPTQAFCHKLLQKGDKDVCEVLWNKDWYPESYLLELIDDKDIDKLHAILKAKSSLYSDDFVIALIELGNEELIDLLFAWYWPIVEHASEYGTIHTYLFRKNLWKEYYDKYHQESNVKKPRRKS